MKVAYPRLDWYFGWRLKDYVHLHPDQEARRKAIVTTVLAWHRREELPRYAADLRELSDAIGQPVDDAVLKVWGDRSQAHWERTVHRGLPGVCAIMRTLDDDQVRQVGKGIDEDLKDFAEERVEPSILERRRTAEKNMIKGLKRWTGTLNDRQLALIHAWREAYLPDGEQQLAYRQRWREVFLELMAHRTDPPFCDGLEKLVLDPGTLRTPEESAIFQDNLRRWQDLMIGMFAAMDEKQQAYARKEITSLAADFEDLARTTG